MASSTVAKASHEGSFRRFRFRFIQKISFPLHLHVFTIPRLVPGNGEVKTKG